MLVKQHSFPDIQIGEPRHHIAKHDGRLALDRRRREACAVNPSRFAVLLITNVSEILY